MKSNFKKSSINAAINSIYSTLEKRIIDEYDIGIESSAKVTDELLSIHGMSKSDLAIIDNVEKLIVEKMQLSEVSIDDNSNKSEISIKGAIIEATAPISKIVGYRFLYRKLTEIYGKDEAEKLTAKMYDFTLAINDSTNILLAYCWAFDASVLISEGKPFGQLQSKPVKRMDSYISLLNEVIHQMSNNLAGAIAIGSFFFDCASLLIKEGCTIEQIKETKNRKMIENQFQRIVHGVNSLSRSGGVESPFTNISIFDRPKIKKILEDKMWMFEGSGLESKDIVNFIVELQKIYMEFFDKGDPVKGGIPYRFPVSTLNISISDDDKPQITDEVFLKQCCKQDIFRYNIFVSKGERVASCCRLWSDAEMLDYASQSNSFGAGGSLSLGSHRVVTLNYERLALVAKDLKHFIQLINDNVYDAKKILYGHKKLLYDLVNNQIFVKQGWINFQRMFSTVGIIGYVEAEEILKNRFKSLKNDDLIELMLNVLNEAVNNNNEEFDGCVFNIEQIPGESMSHRIPRADKIIFDLELPYEILANQFIPLFRNNDVSVWEKMTIDGKYLKQLTGGGISHINIGEHITGTQALSIIKYAVECGLEHFALTGTFCQCVDNHVVIGDRDACSVCGKEIVSKIARVVGFFIDIADSSKYKQEFDFPKRKEYMNKDFDTTKIA